MAIFLLVFDMQKLKMLKITFKGSNFHLTKNNVRTFVVPRNNHTFQRIPIKKRKKKGKVLSYFQFRKKLFCFSVSVQTAVQGMRLNRRSCHLWVSRRKCGTRATSSTAPPPLLVSIFDILSNLSEQIPVLISVFLLIGDLWVHPAPKKPSLQKHCFAGALVAFTSTHKPNLPQSLS